MRVTKWGECGILCALHLARRYGEAAIGAVDISESQGLDLQYTQQILQRLRKGGVIESSRGPHGGYRLSNSPEQTTLKSILYATEGDTFQIICEHSPIHPNPEDSSLCATRENCSLHTVWQDLRSAIDDLLEKRTLADLINLDESKSPLVQLTKRNSEESVS
jgi:Rrf2 family iron-sulfur cluster assembly transcriptional regulator